MTSRDYSAGRTEATSTPTLIATSMYIRNFSSACLELHRAGRELSYAVFQEAALDALRTLIPFDSAWWGNAAAQPMEIHRLHLHNCPTTILEDYVPYIEQDFFRAELMAHPGRTINMSDLTTRARFVRTKIYRDVGRKYHIEWSLGTLIVEPVSSLQEFLTLWRHDPRTPFTEEERRTKELIMAHVVDAHRYARLRAVLGLDPQRTPRWAVTDTRGYLREASPGFVHFVRDLWPQWQGSRLPDDLLDALDDDAPRRLANYRITREPKGEFRYVEILAPSILDSLSAREREVAERYARGETHAQIASALVLAPATVRNHIARAYRKLAVNNKAELILRIAKTR